MQWLAERSTHRRGDRDTPAKGWREAGQVRGNVVPCGAPEVHRVLARHRGMVAFIVRCSVGDVAGGEHGIDAFDAQVAVHMQAAECIALGRDLLRERAGAHARRPDHRLGIDTLAVGRGQAVLVHGGHRHA